MSTIYPKVDVSFRGAVQILPDDGEDLGVPCNGLYVGGEGDIVFIPLKGNVAITLKNVQEGTILHIAMQRVLETGTTATHLVALY